MFTVRLSTANLQQLASDSLVKYCIFTVSYCPLEISTFLMTTLTLLYSYKSNMIFLSLLSLYIGSMFPVFESLVGNLHLVATECCEICYSDVELTITQRISCCSSEAAINHTNLTSGWQGPRMEPIENVD